MVDKRDMAGCKVYLVPGFFGFTNLGALSYFRHVSDVLEKDLRRRGLDAQVIECPTQPTGSIPRRAERLSRHILETDALEADEIHFVGHSTGGLDARLMLSPVVHAAKASLEEQIGDKTKSLITMAAPHYGTPLASFFTTVQGRHLLRLLARLATSRGGRVSIVILARVLAGIARLDDAMRKQPNVLDYLSKSVFRQLTISRDDPVWQFLRDVSNDQGVILQLTPESMNLYNALTRDRPNIAYSCVVTAAPPPPFNYRMEELVSPERALLAGVFVAFHTINRWHHGQYPYPRPDDETAAKLRDNLPFDVNDQTNDGIIPTLSQLKGRLLQAVAADHLDVVGQFNRKSEPLSDWLPSGAYFDQERFEWLWGVVADEILRSSLDGSR